MKVFGKSLIITLLLLIGLRFANIDAKEIGIDHALLYYVQGADFALSGQKIPQSRIGEIFPNLIKVSNGKDFGTALVYENGRILTAAHIFLGKDTCIKDDMNFGVVRCYVHPKFQSEPRDFDFAVCTSSKFTLYRNGKGVELKPEFLFDVFSNPDPVKQSVLVVGFGCANPNCGKTSTKGGSGIVFGHVDIIGALANSSSTFLAEPEAGRCTVVCEGDSGGPVYLRRKAEVPFDAPYLEVVGSISRYKDKISYLSGFNSEFQKWIADDDNFKREICQSS